MQSIKSYTDLEQSKKLAEFLPLESADMSWVSNGLSKPFVRTIPIKGDPEELCGCWSLAALLNVIPISYKDEGEYCFALLNTSPSANPVEWCACYEDCYGNMIMECYADNPVDACVDMIERLHELNLL